MKSILEGAARRALAFTLLAALPSSARAGDWKLEPFGVKNRKADFELKAAGYFQTDFRSYRGWQVEEPAFRNDTLDIRRLRLGVEGKLKKLAFDFDYELGGPARDWINDGEPPFAEAELKNLYGEIEFSKSFALRAGHFKVPVSPEFLTSARRTDLQERSLLANALAPDREWGVMALGRVAKRLGYMVGVFKGDGSRSASRAETTLAARLVVEARDGLELAGSFAQGDVEAEPDGPGTDPRPKGFLGRSPTGWRFYERKFVHGRRLRWGADGQYLRGRFGLKAELLQGRQQRQRQSSIFQDLPEEVASGWSATASFILTGDKKERALKPKRPLTKGGIGLVELTLRYESLRFDDDGPGTGFEGAGNRASNLRPAQDRIFWAGLSWLPTEWTRLYANVLFERYLDGLLAPEPTGARFVSGQPLGRGTYVTFLARLQFMFP